MAKRNSMPQFSQGIGDFLNMMESAVKDYNWNSDQVNRLDSLTQDYLHKLELEDLTYHERARVASSLAECRRARRAHKDMVQVLSPLIEYLNSEKGKNMFNLMRETLGKTRKVEERMENRVYIPRVLEE